MKKYLKLFGLAFALLIPAMPAQAESHPRLWVTTTDLTRLRGWATTANPIYRDGLSVLATRAKADMDSGAVPAQDCGGVAYDAYPTEMYAELFAFMSLIENDAAVRTDYANRARTLLMYAINLAAQGPASVADYVCPQSQATDYPPFRNPKFFTEDSDRARYHGEAFPLVVDWIYPILTTTDKQAIRTVFLRWSQEIVERGYHHPLPLNTVNDPVLLADTSQVRWSGNNYFTAHMRNLGMMALSLDVADDSASQLHNYLANATGSWLYIFDNLSRNDSKGGLLPEGFEYGPQTASYAIQFLLALRSAGADTCGTHCKIQGNPFWDDLLSAYYHSLSPASFVDPSAGQLYQPAWYGDAQDYRASDLISAFGALGMYDTLAGNTTRLESLRWAQINTPPGGADWLLSRVSNSDDYRKSLLYFLLLDPAVTTPSDPRGQLPLDHFASGLGKILSRTGWDTGASWFNFSLSWNGIDHQQADGNHFEWYRKGEWLTKARTGYADIAEGIASSEFRNSIALENDMPNRDASDWRIDLWQRGSQWNYVTAGNPQLLAHSENTSFTYATGDATNLYNSVTENSTDILHASRSIVWIKPDAIVVYDRAQSKTANRFKRAWLQLVNPATVSGNRATAASAGGQQLAVTSLLPSGATLTAVNTSEAQIARTVANNEPMKVRLRIDAPGNPSDVRFLQVLQAADAGAAIGTPTLIQTSDAAWQGAQVDTTVVLFPATLGRTFAGLSYTFQTPVVTHIITGLSPSTAYSATLTGTSLSLSVGGSQLSDSAGVFQYPALAVATAASVIEFFNTSLDNYFITADASEAAGIDGGSAGPGWIRTGNTFKSGGSTSVCRFYGSQSPGPNSHFYTLAGSECDGLKQLQASTPATEKRWNYESLDFVSTPPTTTGTNGTCPTGATPIYRAYNNGFTRGIDSNHRITSSPTAIQEVVTRGWSNEGVVMCAPN